ncbi:MAG: NAD-dependent epimerase/dehydratase family protein, partial [Polyangiaceae bacterium]|nr:NAD-dependent epimerase/dehydratase family protein [Polyangiaceae bacterium]
MKPTVLVTGGAGYIGSTLVPRLLHAGHRVVVVDRFFFGQDSLASAVRQFGDLLRCVRADVRRLDARVFDGVDAVIDLAGISNDPSCELAPELTRDINYHAAVSTMRAAQAAGVRRFVFASSCSVYGRGEGIGLTELSALHPVSLYARCKADAEKALLELRRDGFAVTILRLATVFGPSPRMRFDLAVNVMTKNAYTKGQITVDGGGKQWRPFVHVADVADTMMFMLSAEPARIDGEVFNVGHNDANVRILNLAYRVRDAIPGTQIVLAPTDPDLRNYNV